MRETFNALRLRLVQGDGRSEEEGEGGPLSLVHDTHYWGNQMRPSEARGFRLARSHASRLGSDAAGRGGAARGAGRGGAGPSVVERGAPRYALCIGSAAC